MGNTYHNVHLHIVFSCKDRRPLITPEIQKRLFEFISGICRKRACTLVEGGGVADHVHLLVELAVTKSIADLLRDIKTNSSRWIHETWPEREFGWQDGYGVFSVCASMMDKTRQYIRNQEQHHRSRSLEEELGAILEMHGMRAEPDGSVARIEGDSDDSAAPEK